MLVLTRKAQEQIQIGDGITVTVIKVKGNTVRIGIDAPSDVKIIRGELEMISESAEEEAAADVPVKLDRLEKDPAQRSIDGSSVGGEGQSGGYQVLSFRIKPEAKTESKTENRQRSQPVPSSSMREFLQARGNSAR